MSEENNSLFPSAVFLGLAIAYFIWTREWDRKLAEENLSDELIESESGNSQK